MSAGGALELWAGVECTVRRVRDSWDDQLMRSGHAARIEDIDRLASLGVRHVRFPVLWERVAQGGEGTYDWRWSDRWLDRLRDHGIEPIVGLLHHGCGPAWTNFLDPAFPRRFAEYARRVAERYPWVETYTPINEPLTTARFSGLYGHWHPHGRDAATFTRIFVAQCRAIALAMRAIRELVPGARLLQTEDLGATHATPALAYQADFENERRWLTLDALTGRIGLAHPLYAYLGAAAREDTYCPPDIIGVNHYVTSERFLDERLDGYPESLRGGNGRHEYADVEAVRAPCVSIGLAGLLTAAWERYRLPLVVSEVHLGCTREHQMRWLRSAWQAASTCRAADIPVAAVTLWSVFGAWDWASLLTRQDGHYEVGAFDVRGPAPRPTALAIMARDMVRTGHCDHPALDGPGWWDRRTTSRAHRPRAILVRGGGRLARAVRACCGRRALAWTDSETDAYWAVVETRRRPRVSPPVPTLIFASEPNTMPAGVLAIRYGACFGGVRCGAIARTLSIVESGIPVTLDDSEIRSFSYVPDLLSVGLDLLIDGEAGDWPLVTGVSTRFHLACALAERIGLNTSLIRPMAGRSTRRVLNRHRGWPMPPLSDAISRWAEALHVRT
ncbi:MAG TPA: family 1 glycosylhydrolase [Gemmatimonadaceae bacterium]|nr:family 1 glycosylhydrolase [Gemmatimonadaceae bacterium]